MAPFRDNLRFLMRRRGMLVPSLARRTGISCRKLRRYLDAGPADLALEEIIALARVLGVGPEALAFEPTEAMMERMRGERAPVAP